MPEPSRFYGCIIAMFYNDHPPAHFHVRYGGHRATIAVVTLAVLQGVLPPRALGLVVEWASQHRDELRQAWQDARADRPLNPISPLE